MSAINLTNAECAMLYQDAYDYLLNHTDGLTREILDTYLECNRLNSLDEVFRIAAGFVNDMYKPKRSQILYGENNFDTIIKILHQCDFHYFMKKYAEHPENFRDELMNQLTFKDKESDFTKKSVSVYVNVLCSISKYMSQFSDINAMYQYFDKFKTIDERIQLGHEVQIASHEAHFGKEAWAFKLAVNWIKDTGMEGYCKPDSNVTDFVSDLKIEESKSPEAVFRRVVDTAEKAKSSITTANAFRFDRMLYLIGSGDFYSHRDIVTYHGSMEEFVAQELAKLKRN